MSNVYVPYLIIHLTLSSIAPGKAVILLKGRFAGKKAVVVRKYSEGTKRHPYPHAIVAGIERYPLKVNKRMGSRRIAKRSRIKPFVKTINVTHALPTRYTVDLDLRPHVSQRTLQPGRRRGTKRLVKRIFEKAYAAGEKPWFFAKLRY